LGVRLLRSSGYGLLLNRVTRAVKAFLYKLTDWHGHLGVLVAVDLIPDRDQPAALAKLFAALDLVEQYGPNHLARMRALIHGILVFPLESGNLAEWHQNLNACLVSAEWIREKDTSPEAVASCFVHEVTHARLDALGFAYDNASRARVERICAQAERNFVQRLPESERRNSTETEIVGRLELGDDYWTDKALERRARLNRKDWPFWRRAAYGAIRRLASIAIARDAT
jgi:hypothetical protein